MMSGRWKVVVCHLLSCFVALSVTTYVSATDDQSRTYYTLNTSDGFSDDHILQLLQLPDGRILAVSDSAIDIYDGLSVSHIRRSTAERRPLLGYEGATHLYLDDSHRLWVKGWRYVACYDLCHLCPWESLSAAVPDSVTDLFLDSNKKLWTITPGAIRSAHTVLTFPVDTTRRVVQDIDVFGDQVFIFCQTGKVLTYAQSDGRLLHVAEAYAASQRALYDATSLVVKGPDSCFYQLRTGVGGGLFLRYDPVSCQWQRLLQASHLLHSLVVLPSGLAYITLPDGYMDYNLHTGESHHYSALRLPDGSQFEAGINAFCHDRLGGIWLGTYAHGLLYTSPLSGIFDTQPIEIPVRPILSDIFVRGERVLPDSTYAGRVLIHEAPPYVRSITLPYTLNAVSFQFSAMNYVRPRATAYRYRLLDLSAPRRKGDDGFFRITADSAGDGFVDNRGALYLPLVGLSPGRYRLEVMASTDADHWSDADIVAVELELLAPWWRTGWAYCFYFMAGMAVIGVAVWVYTGAVRRRLERKRREEVLMFRIQYLVEQVRQYEHSASRVVLSEPSSAEEQAAEEQVLSPQDLDFMRHATALVEQHLSDSQYGVEQLASELCMERTGLYRRLKQMMDQSPVVFIRTIRLHRAADLLREGKHTVTEVSELTGFGTVSYFSKCFQREFGCKPSEYHQ